MLYLAIPFDIIPDFIPVLRYVDDMIVVVLALALFLRLRPSEVLQEHMERVGS